MDPEVQRAMAQWPSVPDCYGWLALSARGAWRMGPRGEAITHPGLAAFISRNYSCDARGAWYFQNGPQRVWVGLEGAPLVWRFAGAGGTGLLAHTGAPSGALRAAHVDELGRLWLVAESGPGMLDDRELPRLLPLFADTAGCPVADEAIERWFAGAADAPLQLRLDELVLPLTRIASSEASARLGFIAVPAP